MAACRAGAEGENNQMSPTVRMWIKLAAWLSFAAIAVVTVVPIGLRPTTPYSGNTERFCIMAIVGGLFVLAYPRRPWAILGVVICATGLLEPLQFLALGRHASFHDVVVKSAGVATGGIITYFVGLICCGELRGND
jgi:hypothetical protein